MVKRWDEQSQAYVEPVNVPMRYDEDSQAYVETTGMAWDAESQAYSEVWGQKVSAYVYGAVLETVTIKKDGIIVATVATNSDGVSDEQIVLAYGTYTLTGSVSGWTEEQMVDKYTTKFRAMPEGALYWYGNECSWITGGWDPFDGGLVAGSSYSESGHRTNNIISVDGHSKIYAVRKANNGSWGNSAATGITSASSSPYIGSNMITSLHNMNGLSSNVLYTHFEAVSTSGIVITSAAGGSHSEKEYAVKTKGANNFYNKIYSNSSEYRELWTYAIWLE